MKSRGTICLLLAAVAAVWGVVAWKIFVPAHPAAPVAQRNAPVPEKRDSGADTLRLDYPDPFLKGSRPMAAVRPAVRRLPHRKPAPPRRERIEVVHLGSVCSADRRFHILTIGGEQYELAAGEAAAGFVLAACGRDSLYLRKAGVTYAVKRCE